MLSLCLVYHKETHINNPGSVYIGNDPRDIGLTKNTYHGNLFPLKKQTRAKEREDTYEDTHCLPLQDRKHQEDRRGHQGRAGGNSVTLLPVQEAQDTQGYSLIFCGFPVQAHSVPVPAQNFIKSLKAGQKLALFSTHGSLRGGRMPKEAIENAIGIAKNAKILGSFTCRGQVESEIIDALMNKPEHKAWAIEATSANGHPDSADLDEAKTFAKDMFKKAGSM